MQERVSNLPRVLACSASLFPPLSELPDVSPVSDAAGPSTEAHRRIAQAINGGYLLGAIPDDMAPEVVRLYAAARQAWKKLHHAFPNPQAERELVYTEGPFMLTGHVDVASYDPITRHGVVNDWKGMASEPDAIEQVEGYAFGLSREHPEMDTCDGYLVLLESRELVSWTWTREELDAWWLTVKKALTEWDGAYHPGEHCQWCPKLTACPGRRTLIKSFTKSARMALEDLTPTALVEMRGHAKIVAKMAKDFLDALKLYVKARGPVECEDGRVLRLRPKVTKKLDLLLSQAVTAHTTNISPDDFLRCCTLAKGKLEKAVAATVTKGKGKAKAALMEWLTEAGAVTETVSESLVVDRNKKAIPVETK